jgi:DNA-binding transcriptional MerR regulator
MKCFLEGDSMASTGMKVGDLAQRTGISVRTLHYYDEIGLLSPAQRTESGYRLYGEADVIRLQQVMSLRQIGFSLEQIRQCLDQREYSLLEVVQMQLSRLQQRIQEQQQLCCQLESIAHRLSVQEEVTLQELLQLIEVTTMLDKYYTPEQLNYLATRREELGQERIQQVEAEWQHLIEQVRTEMVTGQNPSSESVQILAQQWSRLIQEFTGGDAGILNSLQTLYQQEGSPQASQGMLDPEVMEFMSKALAVLQSLSQS